MLVETTASAIPPDSMKNSELSNPERITISIPNQDSYVNVNTIIPKHVLQKGYLDKKGCTINFCNQVKMITDVNITEDYIFITLE